MARLITTDFEIGDAAAWSSQEGLSFAITQAGNADITSLKSATGRYCWHTPASGTIRLIPKADLAEATFYHKFQLLYTKNGKSGGRPFLYDEAPSYGYHSRYFIDDNGVIHAQGNSVSGAEASGTIQLLENTWYEIQIEHIAANNGLMKVWVNNVLEIDLSTDTRRSNVVDVGQLRYGTAVDGYDYYYDELFLNDDTGDTDNSIIPFGTRIETFRPASNSLVQQWSASPFFGDHILNVLNDPFQVGVPADTSRVFTSQANLSEIFNIGNISSRIIPNSLITSVNVIGTTQALGTSQQKLLIKISGIEYLSDNYAQDKPSNTHPSLARFVSNPNTGSSWNISDLDMLLFGTKSITADDTITLSDIGLMVEYIPAVQELFVLDAGSSSVIKSSLDGSNSEIIVTREDMPRAMILTSIDIDTVNNKLYWTNTGGAINKLFRSDLDGENAEAIDIYYYIGRASHIAIDNTNRKIYISDELSGNIRVFSINDDLNTITSFDTITNPSFDNPRAICVDDENDLLFWIDTSNYIIKSTLDKFHQWAFLYIEPGCYTDSLAIDKKNRRIYYASTDGYIKSIGYDGTDQRIIATSGVCDVGEMDFNHSTNYLYWLNKLGQKLYRKNVSGGDTEEILNETDGLFYPKGLKLNFQSIRSIIYYKSLFIEGSDNGVRQEDNITIPSSEEISEIQDDPDTSTLTYISNPNLFLRAPEPNNDSITLFIGSIETNDNISLFIQSPFGYSCQSFLFATGPSGSSDSFDLLINGYDIISSSGDVTLFTHGNSIVNVSGDLFVCGLNNTLASGNLYIYGSSGIIDSNQLSLFISGPNIYNDGIDLTINGCDINSDDLTLFSYGYNIFSASGDLLICGSSGTAISSASHLYISGPSIYSQLRLIDWLIRTADYYPQIIGLFDIPASGATIEVWNISDENNVSINLIDNLCYQIGTTSRWGWSTINLPESSGYNKHYFYKMTSSNGELFYGEFLFAVPEDGVRSHPNYNNEYISKI